ncbi:MAG TPA: hypothetical protein VMW34_09895, partial [Anaerolineales bacterium]|nr:hypothetical protein [Anaerolineales bacterium]
PSSAIVNFPQEYVSSILDLLNQFFRYLEPLEFQNKKPSADSASGDELLTLNNYSKKPGLLFPRSVSAWRGNNDLVRV